tara:strand:- start:1918 stop:2562 length:645 start_codon:yes stop_codon:yes gene_type:complete
MTNMTNIHELILSIEKDNTLDSSICEKCLITNSSIEENAIKLSCNHIFNYEAIYNEVIYQKIKKHGMIRANRFLKHNEIKCPYCSKITSGYLPYYKYYNIKNVNSLLKNNTNELQNTKFFCQHNSKNNKQCNNIACNTEFGNFCNKHIKYTKDQEEIVKNLEEHEIKIYKNKKLIELKELLKRNNCIVGGNKNELIIRILINKKQNKNWIETTS